MRGEMGKVIHSLLTAFPQGYPQLFHRMSSTYPQFQLLRPFGQKAPGSISEAHRIGPRREHPGIAVSRLPRKASPSYAKRAPRSQDRKGPPPLQYAVTVR